MSRTRYNIHAEGITTPGETTSVYWQSSRMLFLTGSNIKVKYNRKLDKYLVYTCEFQWVQNRNKYDSGQSST